MVGLKKNTKQKNQIVIRKEEKFRYSEFFHHVCLFSTFEIRRLDPGKETLEGFFQVGNQKEYQNVVIISFVHLEKIDIFCFMHKSVAQKLSPPRPLEK